MHPDLVNFDPSVPGLMALTAPKRYRCASQRKRLFKLHRQHCVWCGCRTELTPYREGETHQPNMATVDHIKSRWVCKTKEEYRAADNLALACDACNKRRSREEEDRVMDLLVYHIMTCHFDRERVWYADGYGFRRY